MSYHQWLSHIKPNNPLSTWSYEVISVLPQGLWGHACTTSTKNDQFCEPPPSAKEAIDLLFKNNKILNHMANFKIPPTPPLPCRLHKYMVPLSISRGKVVTLKTWSFEIMRQITNFLSPLPQFLKH